MITDILPCENCQRIDITGQLPGGKRLCAGCYGYAVGANPRLVKQAMKKSMIRQAENTVPRRFDIVGGNIR